MVIGKKKQINQDIIVMLSLFSFKKFIIVGKIGNGQCIVTAILQRSFDSKSGHLMELKIERLNWSGLSRLIGLVSQESVLFNDFIYANAVDEEESAMRWKP